MKRLLFVLVMAVAGIIAQGAVYTWSQYHLNFEVPDGGFVTYNSNTRFEIQWDEMVMTVQLYNKQESSDKLIRENLQRKALGYSMYDLKQGKIKVKGFKGLTIDGTMPDGSRAIIADLISNKQDLIVEVTVNYLYGNREMVDDMIKSFAENSKNKPNREKHKQKVQSREKAKLEEQKRKQEQQRRQQQEQEQQRRRNEKIYDA
ncbi:MAG: hypothetical protein IJ613_00420 [Muribaculaceae bacterium]|nr:hypothetical protein [Muribaculaceae bacterium]